jgi:redox-sensitive bicupin YhaK (pirin superfamily)
LINYPQILRFLIGLFEHIVASKEVPMNEIRRSQERGFADHGWLKSFHTFSFADYYDPKHVEFGPLRVINEDRVQAGAGFGTHGHRDMEIISYVLSGELAHKDSMGNGSTIRPGDVQRMSAGSGVRHSEFNPSGTEGTHFLQIWIQPDQLNIEPSYEEKRFAAAEKRGRLRLIVSPDRAQGSLLIHQDARIYAGLFNGAEAADLSVKSGRRIYVQVAQGAIEANGVALSAGDALQITSGAQLHLEDGKEAEVLVFDLPGEGPNLKS